MNRNHWVLATIRLNWSNMTANKRAFWTMAALMCAQNLIYFSLWVMVFSRLSSLKGWGLTEVAYLYGAGALGYGAIFTVFGGLNQVASVIRNGTLDVFLARPRSPLLSVMLSRMRADSLGDVVVGLVMLTIFVRPSLHDLPLIAVLSLSAGVVYASVRLLIHSFAFWGLGEEAAESGYIAFLITATNPQKGFGTLGKILLLSVFPAGYIALLPVEILQSFSWANLAWQVGASLSIAAFAVLLFQLGLKRYSSGNKFLMLR